MRSLPVALLPVILLSAAILTACGGDGDDKDGGAIASATPASTGASSTALPDSSGAIGPSGAAASTGGTGSDNVDGEGIDVCTLISKDEVEDILEQTVGDPTFTSIGALGAAAGMTGGDCSFQATSVTSVVSVSVLAWADESDAETSFSLYNTTQEVEGLGDQAINIQPVGDIAVRQGRYELSVSLFFVNDDETTDFEMAREIAELVLSRLP